MAKQKEHRYCFETLQFFEVMAPEGSDSDKLLDDPEVLDHFADLIKTGQIGFKLELVYDEDGNEVCK